MVAVPRSKGCLVCRKRSVKCDEARPSCSQCRRGGRRCSGYDIPLTFINQDTGENKPSKVIESSNQEASRFQSAANRNFIKKKTAAISSSSQQLQRPQSPCPKVIPDVKSADLNRIQLISSFVWEVFPPDTLHPQLSLFANWLWSVPHHVAKSQQLDYAALCLALSFFARESGNLSIQQNSRFAYAKALGYLSKAINTPVIGHSSETLCATMLLSLYEMFMCTEKTSWVRHAGGAGRLMQIRGPHRHKEGFDYTLFLGFRGILIGEAVASRQPCFLDSEDWIAVVTENSGYATSSAPFRFYNEFCNMYAAIPGVVNRLSQAILKGPASNLRVSALADGTKLRARFLDWNSRFEAGFPSGSQPFIEVPSAIANARFPVVYQSDNIWTATWMCSYYACLILLDSRIGILYGINVQEGNDVLVKRICMFVECCVQGGICGISCLSFALPVALSVCKEELRDWIGETLARISNGAEVPQVMIQSLQGQIVEGI